MWGSIVVGMAALVASEGPQPIVNGTDAAVCQFPSVVSLRGSGCSGSLLSPTIVLAAAHCFDGTIAGPTDAVQFGESYADPVAIIPIERCEAHPEYEITVDDDGFPLVLFDVGFCELSVPVTDVPPIPALAGCETDELVEGAELTIVGFGASEGGSVDGQQWSNGGGIKRYTSQVVETVDDPEGDVRMIGPGSGVCFGDSGGPAFLELSDGSWRVVGVGSTGHPATPSDCGYGSVYDLVYPHLEWLESASGVDLTPCHDADGTWNPSEDCDAFPLSPTDEGNEWASSCGPHDLSGLGELCGPAFGEEDSGSSDDGGASSETGQGEDTGNAGGDSDGGGDDSPPDDVTTAAEPPGATNPGDGDSGSEGTGDGGGEALDGAGCGCTTRPTRPHAALIGLVFLVVFSSGRRRRT